MWVGVGGEVRMRGEMEVGDEVRRMKNVWYFYQVEEKMYNPLIFEGKAMIIAQTQKTRNSRSLRKFQTLTICHK